MRIFSKKTLEFTQYKTVDGLTSAAERFTVKPGLDNIVDVPDWVEKDPLFQWAKTARDIQVFESAAEVKNAEKVAPNEKTDPDEKAKTDKKEDSKTDSKK